MRIRLSTTRLTAAVFLALVFSVSMAASQAVVVYPAFGCNTATIVDGRVTEQKSPSEAKREDGKSENLQRNLRMLMNDEQADVSVTVRIGSKTWNAVTDKEGYFRVSIGDLEPATGWREVTATTSDASGSGRLLLVPPANIHGLISDFDDTVVISDVNEKRQLLKNSFLRNFTQREAVPGAAALYARLIATNPDGSSAPLFYLSASPRQLYPSISAFLEHNQFPPGVLITKKVTNDASSEPLRDQVSYKTAKLVEIFERLPHVTFMLIGDDGEQDPEIYQSLRQRYPERVSAIWIRRVNPDPERIRIEGQGDLAELLSATGTAL